jgi:hypothetical protein
MAEVLQAPKGYPLTTMSFYITVGILAGGVVLFVAGLALRYANGQNAVYTDFEDVERGERRKTTIFHLFANRRKSFLQKPQEFYKFRKTQSDAKSDKVSTPVNPKVRETNPSSEAARLTSPQSTAPKEAGATLPKRKLSRRELRKKMGTLPTIPESTNQPVLRKNSINKREFVEQRLKEKQKKLHLRSQESHSQSIDTQTSSESSIDLNEIVDSIIAEITDEVGDSSMVQEISTEESSPENTLVEKLDHLYTEIQADTLLQAGENPVIPESESQL